MLCKDVIFLKFVQFRYAQKIYSYLYLKIGTGDNFQFPAHIDLSYSKWKSRTCIHTHCDFLHSGGGIMVGVLVINMTVTSFFNLNTNKLKKYWSLIVSIFYNKMYSSGRIYIRNRLILPNFEHYTIINNNL